MPKRDPRLVSLGYGRFASRSERAIMADMEAALNEAAGIPAAAANGTDSVAGEKVELMRGLYADFRRGDTESAFEVFAEDIEWDAREVQMLGVGGLFRGHDAVRRFWRQWLEAWQEISWEEVEYEELADGRVRVLINQRNRGRETGIWVDQPPYEMYWTVEEGVVTRMEYRWIH